MTEKVIGEPVVVSLEDFRKAKFEEDKKEDKRGRCFDRILEVLQEEGFGLNIRSFMVQISPGSYRMIVKLDFIPR